MDSLTELKTEAIDLIRCKNEFTAQMTDKITQKLKEGFIYWDKKDELPDEGLLEKIQKNIKDEDWVDVANLAMFLWYRSQPPF